VYRPCSNEVIQQHPAPELQTVFNTGFPLHNASCVSLDFYDRRLSASSCIPAARRLYCYPGENMLMNWLDASKAQDFGKQLAEKFSATYPILDKKKEKASLKKRAKLLGRLASDVNQFGRTNSLNFYKKAKLGNAFKWTLLEKGYDAEFVDELTKEVILALK
jgi:hypothetical protein